MWTILVGSVVVNVTLARQVRSTHGPVAQDVKFFLEVGSQAPDLNLEDTEGRAVQVSFSEAPQATIVYVLSPTCPWCARNQANVVALAERTRQEFRMVGVAFSREGLSDYLKENRLPFPVYVAPEKTRAAYKFRTVPETLVIDKSGVVLRNWGGAFGPEKLKEIEAYFGIVLPGLLPGRSSPAKKS